MSTCTYIGTKYGGWAVPLDLLTADSICYCAGCGEDISFDLGLIEKVGCHIYAFDPTPASIAYVQKKTKGNEAYHFWPIGLWNQTGARQFFTTQGYKGVSRSVVKPKNPVLVFTAECNRLGTLMLSFRHGHIDLLKLDIEGAEFAVIGDMLTSDIRPRVLCVEFHSGAGGSPKAALSDLNDAGYHNVHHQKSDWTLVHREA